MVKNFKSKKSQDLHTYTFLYCDGKGTSGESAIDRFHEVTREARDLKDAIKKTWRTWGYWHMSLKEYLEEYGPEGSTIEDFDANELIQDFYSDDETPGSIESPWLVSYMVDGIVNGDDPAIANPDEESWDGLYDILDSYFEEPERSKQIVAFMRDINLEKWGIDRRVLKDMISDSFNESSYRKSHWL
jgi:hypothetical protein